DGAGGSSAGEPRGSGGGGSSQSSSGGPPGGKRARILDAAVRVFAEKGFYGAKVAEIAREAGVADGTIYLYFKSKDDLLISLFEDRMERINHALRGELGSLSSAEAKLRRFIEMHLGLCEEHRPLVEVLTVELRQSAKFMREYKNPRFAEFLKIIAGIVEEGQRSGELRGGIPPTLCARTIFGALDKLSLARALGRSDHIPADKVADLLIGGIRNPHPSRRHA